MKKLIFVLLFACKSSTTQVKTVASFSLYDKLKYEYTSYVMFPSSFAYFDIILAYDEELSAALSKNQFTADERQHLLKIQHHVRSIIAYAVHSKCFKLPRRSSSLAGVDKATKVQGMHNLEKSWIDRYDYNYYQRGTKDYFLQLQVDTERLCYVFLAKLSELAIEQIDLSQPNVRFFQQAKAGSVASLDVKAMQTAKQQFFRLALAPQIAMVTEQSMARADFLFPFHKQDYMQACVAYRDHYDDISERHGYRRYRYAKKLRDEIDCSALQRLLKIVPRVINKTDCSDKFSFTQKRITETSFANIQLASGAVNDIIKSLNTQRTELDRLVKLREKDFKPRVSMNKRGETFSVPQYYSPHTEKKTFILPFLKVLNATKINDPPVIKAVDTYNCHILEATKRGLSPLIFAKTVQNEAGSVHLSHMGRFFGFGSIEYQQLQLPSQQVLGKAFDEMKHELVANWVELQAARLQTQTIAERKIYETMLSNEIAVAQLLLQDPTYSVVVDDLLRKFQNEPITPKWLRTFKKFALAADLAFIPISIFAGFLTAGIGTIPILLMANAVNFLWIGGAAAEHIIARNRYRLVERSLLTGNSEQVERGMKILRMFHEKRRDLIVSGAIGLPLTLGNLSIIARGLDSATTIPIDVVAAFTADVETLSLPDEHKSDVQLHGEK